MPGHEKKTGGGADPDPSPFLFVPYEEKQKDLAKVILNFFCDRNLKFYVCF